MKPYLKEALEAVVGIPCPFTLPQRSFSELNGSRLVTEIQDWCAIHSRPGWATGLSMMEAAELIVEQAIENANIRIEDERRTSDAIRSLHLQCPSCGSDPDVDCHCKP